MTGKEKCKLLRQIRKEVAANNDIPYFPTECTYEGDDCVGSCPMCEAEAAYLDRKLNEKAATGAAITVRGISMETFREHYSKPVPMDHIPMVEAGLSRKPVEEPLMGVPIPRPDTPGIMAPVDEHRPSKVREKGALRPRDLRRMKDELEIMKLDLSTRAMQVLVGADIKTISQLISLSTEDLRKLDGISKKHMEEIIKKVHDAGLYFKGENQWVDF